MKSSKPSRRRRLRILVLTGAAILILIAALFVFAEPLLCVRSSLSPADAIVVLGGEPLVRVKTAAALITNGYAPSVFLTGQGDCEDNLRHLQQLGISTNHVVLECDSISTQENALFTVKLLRERQCKRVIIVTSWFHSRRALSCFSKYAPEIEFLSAPAPRSGPFRYERNYIAREYIKIAWYALRWQVLPWT